MQQRGQEFAESTKKLSLASFHPWTWEKKSNYPKSAKKWFTPNIKIQVESMHWANLDYV